MSSMFRHRPIGAVGLLMAASLLTACGGGDADPSANPGEADPSANPGEEEESVRLVVNTFGNFGYDALLEEYMQEHENVEVVERVSELNQHHQQLAQHLAAGSGAGDIEAIDESFIVQFRSRPDNFYNLFDYGIGEIEDRWLEWKWDQSLASDDYQIGLGTDVGGLAMCYRRDLFQEAGLPVERDEVSALWPNWDSFIEVGKRFEAAGTEAHWVDAATNMFNPILAQQPVGYFSEENELTLMTNPAVKTAWDLTVKMIQADESAKLAPFTAQWNTGFKQDSFATLACPAWMQGYIQEQAPETAGMWDIAAIPGGGGNWGGSFLTIPTQSEHPEEAYALAAWLTAPEQELRIFKETGNLPSIPALYDNPALTSYTNPFFNDAPVGEIFTTAAENLEPQYLGPKTGPVRQAVENAMRQVEQGTLTPEAGWERAVQDAQRAAR